MKEKILCVDDEQNVLAAIQRQLRTRFHIDTAIRGELGLQALASRGPYAVVVSDMRMPEMDGVQFLRLVKQRAPDSVRIMLTGNHELRTAMQAVNEGSIFRFLTKPCPPETFADALEAGVRQYRLITAERDLLEKTLSGAIRVLAEILAVIDPQVFVRAEKLRDHARSIGKALQADNIWELEVSALLSQLGLVTIPRAVVNKYRSCLALSSGEKEMLARVPEIGRSLLAHIPRLESVAEIVLYQSKHFDGSGIPQDAVSGERIPLGARVLKIAGDLIQLEAQNMTGMKALHLMRQREGWYDPQVLDAAVECLQPDALILNKVQTAARPCSVNDLRAGQTLATCIRTRDGRLLLTAGQRLSQAALVRILNAADYSDIEGPIFVQDADTSHADGDEQAARQDAHQTAT